MPSRKTPASKNAVETEVSKEAPKTEPSQEYLSADQSHTPLNIPPNDIRPNPRNPRKVFPQKRIESLAESFAEVGVLVPLTVYEDLDEETGTRYVLLDGERRLRAAKLNNDLTVPAWVIKKPASKAANTLRMFNIHLMRDDWGDMATALALKDLIEETGEESDAELGRMTGLSKDTVKNMKRVLAFPEPWQKRVLDDEVPFNLLVELDKAILTKKADKKKADFTDLSVKQLRDFFLKKYDQGVVTDVVSLRKVGTLIDTAVKPENHERMRQRAKKALQQLLKAGLSIEDAYQYGAAGSVEIKQILRDVDNLPGRLQDVAEFDLDAEDRVQLREALKRLHGSIAEVMKSLK
jgi:ParB family chromosome partitioning protein